MPAIKNLMTNQTHNVSQFAWDSLWKKRCSLEPEKYQPVLSQEIQMVNIDNDVEVEEEFDVPTILRSPMSTKYEKEPFEGLVGSKFTINPVAEKPAAEPKKKAGRPKVQQEK